MQVYGLLVSYQEEYEFCGKMQIWEGSLVLKVDVKYDEPGCACVYPVFAKAEVPGRQQRPGASLTPSQHDKWPITGRVPSVSLLPILNCFAFSFRLISK